MAKFTYIKLMGKTYPLLNTIIAMENVAAKYGSFDDGWELLYTEKLTKEMLRATRDIIFEFINEGVRYKNMEGAKKPDGTPYEQIPYDDLGTMITHTEAPSIIALIRKAAFEGDLIDVEIKEDPKNALCVDPQASSGSTPGQE